jgi:BCD family chlorophyll transporter-like MFS transporter
VLLFSLPYLLSFIQVAIGSFSDRHPILGFRRTPYILVGLLLCVAGLLMAPGVASQIVENFWGGVALGLATFGAWGMGFNFATVGYFSLASELSSERNRGKVTAIMFFVMIVSIIITAAGMSRMLESFSAQQLQRSFEIVALAALVMGLLGLVGLEKRLTGESSSQQRFRIRAIVGEVLSNPQVALFFFYLILMLAAILGQDVLLEPFAARAFALPVSQTTRITSIWGVCFLLSLIMAGILENRFSKVKVARLAALAALTSFLLIAISGLAGAKDLFYIGVVLLGLATGPATVSNLSLMLDMTVPGKVGLFIGAWGAASAFARLVGSFTTAVVRDLANMLPNNALGGYLAAFLLQMMFLAGSIVILRRINVDKFKCQASISAPVPSVVERAAISSDL